jgi:hypothetical protein
VCLAAVLSHQNEGISYDVYTRPATASLAFPGAGVAPELAASRHGAVLHGNSAAADGHGSDRHQSAESWRCKARRAESLVTAQQIT